MGSSAAAAAAAVDIVCHPAMMCLRAGLCKMAATAALHPMRARCLETPLPLGRPGSGGVWGRCASAASECGARPARSNTLALAPLRPSSPRTVAVSAVAKRTTTSKANSGVAADEEEEASQCGATASEGLQELDGDEGVENAEEALAEMTGTISLTSEVPLATTSVCVGIDPDLSGAIAVLRTWGRSTLAEVIDVPCVTVTVNKKKRRRHDYQSISALVRGLRAPEGSIAYVEQAMPFPKDGKQGWYITGYGYGVWLGILAAAGFTVIPVQAKIWKTAMGICGREFGKDDSRAMASSFFPVLSPQLKRKKDHGRAEALLIAAFGKGMTVSKISPVDELPQLRTSPAPECHDSIMLSSHEPPF